MTKMFCALGVHEPGDNFLGEEFRWSRDVDSMPGWELVSYCLFLLCINP
jgi:hypothetical protein